MPHEVIMPALGMAQDTGLLVAWRKAPGDAVAAGEVLFEVETDKATMEVEAGADGFIAALLAEAGEEAPVGHVIAVISAEKPANPVQSNLSGTAAPAPPPAPESASKPQVKPAPAKTVAIAPVARGGPILASPKARRLALEQGLDLARLVAHGAAQPYHVADLETLRRLPDAATAVAHVTARVSRAGFADFVGWLDGRATAEAVWAAFAASSLRAATGAATLIVRLDQPTLGQSMFYADPDLGPLSAAAPGAAALPGLIVRDLTLSRITTASPGAGDAPALTLTRAGEDYAIALDYGPGQITTDAALNLIDGFAARLDEPLCHLL